MDKKPRRMDFAEYTMEVQHTHTWYYADEVLPPPNENVIVETKETLSYQCAFYVKGEEIKKDLPVKFFFEDERGIYQSVTDGIQDGFYVEEVGSYIDPHYRLVDVIRWTDCPSMGINAESMNVMHALRRYFRQSGRTDETKKKIMRLVKEVYGENPVNWEELENDKS